MWPIVIVMILYCAFYLYDFPGGVKGFYSAMKGYYGGMA